MTSTFFPNSSDKKPVDIWIFGYGSLMWRPGFPYEISSPALVRGWTRRFWQGSHDHRGTPEQPGRVVTLVPEQGGICEGIAFLVSAHQVPQTLIELDHREKNGYQRQLLPLEIKQPEGVAAAPSLKPLHATGLTYIATADNHAYLGPDDDLQLSRHIADSIGPSGSNADYLMQLAKMLRRLEINDPHVFALEHLLNGD